MRKWNALISAAVLVMFLLHGIFSAFSLMGAGHHTMKTLAWTAAGLTAVHALIGLVLTVQTIRVQKRAGYAYVKENCMFWARRISGFAVLIFLVIHMLSFHVQEAGGMLQLPYFSAARLAGNLLLVLTTALHIVTNTRPLLMSFGISGGKKYAGDICFAISIALLFTALGFVFYYLRWNLL